MIGPTGAVHHPDQDQTRERLMYPAASHALPKRDGANCPFTDVPDFTGAPDTIRTYDLGAAVSWSIMPASAHNDGIYVGIRTSHIYISP
jgi:hypothetical protein